jgi:hypothetical protein
LLSLLLHLCLHCEIYAYSEADLASFWIESPRYWQVHRPMHGSYCSLNGSRSKSRKLGATLNRMHMGRRAITAILALLLAASSRLVSTASNPQQQSVRAQHSKPAGQDTHNPLEKIAVHNTALRLDNGIQIQVNSTTLTESGQWFEVGAVQAHMS